MTTDTGRDYHRQIFDTCESLMQLIGRLPVPVIAAVDGLAAAAGCQLVASADIAVATPGSRFSTPGASVGLFCHTPGIPLARRVPRAVSGYMLLTGEPISGEEALRAGLISKVRLKKCLKNLQKSKPGMMAIAVRYLYSLIMTDQTSRNSICCSCLGLRIQICLGSTCFCPWIRIQSQLQ